MVRSIHDRVRKLRACALGAAAGAACLGLALALAAPGAAGAAGAEMATRLLGIEAEPGDDGARLRLHADGEIAGAQSFVLDDPKRLVLDLPGLTNEVARQRIDVGTSHARRVRIGQHPDKVRVVVDGGGAERPFDGHVLMPRSDGLWVAVGEEAARLIEEAPGLDQAGASQVAGAPGEPGGPVAPRPLLPPPPQDEARLAGQAVAAAEPLGPVAAAEAMAGLEAFGARALDAEIRGEPTIPMAAPAPAVAAPAPAPAPPVAAAPVPGPAPVGAPMDATAEPARSSATARVHGVQHDVQAHRDRLVIVLEGGATHSLMRPDDETLVVSLRNAVLDAGADVRITPQRPGPVSLVTALQMPDVDEPEVRIAIARQPGVEPDVNRQGDLLVLDFPREGEATASAEPLGTGRTLSVAAPEAVVQGSGVIPPEDAPAAPMVGSSVGMLREGGLIGGKTYTGRRISLDFKDVEISDVLRLIAEVSDLNVIAGDEVKGNITIRLTDVPWDQALDVILLTKGLGFVLVGNVLRIAPQTTLQAEEAARLEERRAKEKLEDLVVKLQPVNYASVAEVEDMVKKLLTPRGSINIDKRTNTLILKDIQSVVDEAVALVKAIDTPTPQVLIESKIVEARLDFSRELGAVWGVGSNPQIDAAPPIPPQITTRTTTFPFQQPNNVIVSNPITSTANGLLNLGGYILDERFNLTLQLQAAESSGEGKVISSPRVVTLDNREARIEQGVSIPFQTFENGDAQLEFIDAVLSLLVTPHITADKTIIMKIEVTRNAPDASVPTPTGSPAIAKNEARTETLVKNGQTLVLGGIYVVDRAEQQTRVPFIYRIPLLGNAFKSKQLRDQRRELLIFVTPRIVEGGRS